MSIIFYGLSGKLIQIGITGQSTKLYDNDYATASLCHHDVHKITQKVKEIFNSM